jgi:glycosyltransferase involved in cell wall biosynthesis
VAGNSVRLLVLSFYYAPDLSAGSFRTSALVPALAAAAPDARIEILTALPNRYHSFTVEAPAHETHGNVTVDRFALPVHRSGMLDQSHSFLAFARQVARHTRGRHYDLVYATSSRLLTAALGAWIARRTGAALYLDIRDIFVDTIGDVLPARFARPATPLFSLLERWTMRRAQRINLVSRGFADYFAQRYPDRPLSFFTNGIDDEFIDALAAPPPAQTPGPLTVLYAGNLGEGQGLHTIVPALAKTLNGRARFRVIGDGGRRGALLEAVTAAGAGNVQWEPPMPRAALIDAYRAADVLFLHLNDYDAFKKVLPSKLFEYAALGKPIWAGVAGHAADFVRNEIDNAAVFAPCDATQAMQVFEQLTLHDTPRPEFNRKYTRRRIMASMADEVLALARTVAASAAR